MTPLTALLCLALNVGAGTPVQAGTLPRPTLWAEPGSVISWAQPTTFWCRGALGVQDFRLSKESPLFWETQMALEPGNKAKFSISSMSEVYVGTYRCYYYSPSGSSELSNPLELVVTGAYRKPSLSALPSLAVTSGGTVTLRCGLGFDGFILTQEREPETHRTFESQTSSSGQLQALFSVGPVTPKHNWTFRCYGYYRNNPYVWSQPSDPLQLLVSDASGRPSLLSPQGLIVTQGQTLTLQCRSEVIYDQFALFKEGALDFSKRPGRQTQPGLSQADFPLGPVSRSDGGRYRCYGGHSLYPVWSGPSDPLDILVAGQHHDTPILMVQPGPTVSPGENVTLLCLSGGLRDTFLLVKEGTADPPLRVHADNRDHLTPVKFSFHPVTSAHSGTYRCYSSHSITPYLLSQPSAPLQLRVSGHSGNSGHLAPGPMSSTGLPGPLPLILGLSAACVLLSLLLGLLLLRHRRRQRQAGHRKSGAARPKPQDRGLDSGSGPRAHVQKEAPDVAATHTGPEQGAQLDFRGRQDADPPVATNAQVKCTGLGREVPLHTPLSGAPLDTQDGQIEEDRQRVGQAQAPEAPQEVTYAQLIHLDPAQTTAPPSFQSGGSTEPSVYATLAFH
ncbi:leukocyte immunoglobulin-like receptor subfamily A member 6 [Sorex fumeus]|uniref:leukocyte immunoglobulin-like receptor subfamily A member 6 n=1 Tax=Sorex fumeus TaxID=62283 RepID=UPI0024ADF393|nr:leukocyte immunoglobulin-like receptor subfamily A member 6 [Sorex fumeus]